MCSLFLPPGVTSYKTTGQYYQFSPIVTPCKTMVQYHTKIWHLLNIAMLLRFPSSYLYWFICGCVYLVLDNFITCGLYISITTVKYRTVSSLQESLLENTLFQSIVTKGLITDCIEKPFQPLIIYISFLLVSSMF